MPKKIDTRLQARAVLLVQDHRREHSSLNAAAHETETAPPSTDAEETR